MQQLSSMHTMKLGDTMKKAALIIAFVGLLGWAGQSAAEETAPAEDKAALPQEAVAAQDEAPAQEADPVQEEAPAQEADPVQEEALEEPEGQPRQMRITERFGRSMANILSSPFELPAQIYVRAKYQEDRSDNPFAVIGGLIEGIPMGALVYFPWRLFAGVADLFTIWTPVCDKALIYPEYISFSPNFLDRTNLPLDNNPEAED